MLTPLDKELLQQAAEIAQRRTGSNRGWDDLSPSDDRQSTGADAARKRAIQRQADHQTEVREYVRKYGSVNTFWTEGEQP